jgi:3-hydroxybutyryl-CoA dehydrogenase
MVRTVGIVGTGTMGAGIAQVFSAAGLDVIVADVDERAAAKGLASITRTLDRMVEKRKLSLEARDEALGHISPAPGYAALRDADLVLEAVTEDADTKIRVLREIDRVARPETIVASNTSSLSITKLAGAITHPERFIGLHFFNPAPAMELVEIVCGLQTSDATHDEAEALMTKLGKVPISVRNSPGFVVNRILLPMLNEAFFVLAGGYASATDIDEAMKLGCRHPMGPLALADMIGLDVLLSVMQTLHRELGESKYRPAPLLGELVAAGYLGRKSGRGVYRY